ncbi:MAG: hemolysin III family protein [Paracoccaceae bacterium]
MAYAYSAREVLTDAAIHVTGLMAAGTAAVMLMLHLAPSASVVQVAAVGAYLGFLLFSLTASAAYHLLPWERSRDLLHRIDHAAIYLKIAGTYTPLVVLMGSFFSYIILGCVWIIALIGAWAKMRFWATDAKGSLALYLSMGWMSVLLIPLMWTSLPGLVLGLIAVGGLLYTAGTFFFSRENMQYQNAIWHAFVLAASSCFFAAIAMATTTPV